MVDLKTLRRKATQKRADAKRTIKARMRRKALIKMMGGRCAICRTRQNLEFDHPSGRSWCTRKVSMWQRMKLYEEEWEAGKIRLLCGHCNKTHLPGTMKFLQHFFAQEPDYAGIPF